MGKQRLKKVKSNIVESLELPKDILYGAVIITATGKSEILIENYKGIIEYTCEKVRLQTKTCQVEIRGRGLFIQYYTNDEMKITGIVHEIIYDP